MHTHGHGTRFLVHNFRDFGKGFFFQETKDNQCLLFISQLPDGVVEGEEYLVTRQAGLGPMQFFIGGMTRHWFLDILQISSRTVLAEKGHDLVAGNAIKPGAERALFPAKSAKVLQGFEKGLRRHILSVGHPADAMEDVAEDVIEIEIVELIKAVLAPIVVRH